MTSLARCLQGSLFLLVVVLVPLITGCDMPGDSSNSPAQPATPAVEVPPPFTPAPTATFPADNIAVSQTVEGITISVAPLHADAHRVVLVARVQGPAKPYDRAFDLAWVARGKDYMPSLSANGKDLPWVQGGSVIIPPAGEPGDGQSVLAFDASGLEIGADTTGTVQILSLHLSLPVYEDNEPDEYRPWPPGPVVTRAAGATEVPTPTQLAPASRPASRLLPFEFSFQVPFDSERIVLQPEQTVEQNGLSITVRQVDITASEALITLHYAALNRGAIGGVNPGVSAGLTVPSESTGEVFTLVSDPDGFMFGTETEGDIVFSYTEPSLLRKTPVDIALSVSAWKMSASRIGGVPEPSPIFDWTFRFTVPVTSTP
ncbi:MAG TPA: hypothetical protein VFR15_13855 [Chloroflexia bacterium]|nr:hypothetical protein [Chloroflexia bacterium]